jgi:hypothetical protein
MVVQEHASRQRTTTRARVSRKVLIIIPRIDGCDGEMSTDKDNLHHAPFEIMPRRSLTEAVKQR